MGFSNVGEAQEEQFGDIDWMAEFGFSRLIYCLVDCFSDDDRCIVCESNFLQARLMTLGYECFERCDVF